MHIVKEENITPLRKVMRERGHLIVPIIVIVWLLMIGGRRSTRLSTASSAP
jgi:TRAP-type uncharacterized transport system fused permease subunit